MGSRVQYGSRQTHLRPFSDLPDRLHKPHELHAAQVAVYQKVYITFLCGCPLSDGTEQDSTGDPILLKDRRKGNLRITNRPDHVQK